MADDPRPAAVLLQSPIISDRRDADMFPKGFMAMAWQGREAILRLLVDHRRLLDRGDHLDRRRLCNLTDLARH